ncbi:M14 family zinc carboxypeptidase [Salinibacillus xinjiangensis]|uniref:Carboxypeptidase n=1 Tax=Salinibacillus xinjiangensis TaxID=1229268 RepID=A0A6G1X5D8_9BACI|nr:M14 family zinc carboxypeptidase [Salinibacillus xinjiangensis]MRG86116.1 carboxypeptidase [Salinibacillus xinjiangensis]
MKKKKVLNVTTSIVLGMGVLFTTPFTVGAVGEGPGYTGNESIQTSILHTHEEMVDFLQNQEAKQDVLELEVFGQSVKGRDLYLAKYETDPSNPSVLFLTQQHGNEALTTEGALDFIKQLGTGKMKGILDQVNVYVVPMFNADGAMGDVNFSLEDYVADGDRHLTRYNANHYDLNREHDKTTEDMQPEARALHENVFQKYDIDYMIDFHHQGRNSERDGKLVSGSILHPTTPNVDEEVLEGSKRLGAIVFDAIQSKGWGHLGKYRGGSSDNIGRNGIAARYDISTVLFEMRGMADHYYEPYVLGQKSNGYIIKQAVTTMEETVRAIADGSVETADTSFWDTLDYQQ